MKKETKFKIAIIGLVLLIMGTGVSFAWYAVNFEQAGTDSITAKCFEVSIDKSEEANTGDISLSNALPTSDSDGQTLKPYAVTISNKCLNTINYNVKIMKVNGNIPEDKIDFIKPYLKLITDKINKEEYLQNNQIMKEAA